MLVNCDGVLISMKYEMAQMTKQESIEVFDLPVLSAWASCSDRIS